MDADNSVSGVSKSDADNGEVHGAVVTGRNDVDTEDDSLDE